MLIHSRNLGQVSSHPSNNRSYATFPRFLSKVSMRRQWVFETLDTTTTTLLRSNIFNRTLELEKLKSAVKGDPSQILVVLGPRSCGKTALMSSHFSKRLDAVYINCREFDATTPQYFVKKVLKVLMDKIPTDWEQLKMSLPPKIVAGLASAFESTMKGAEMTSWTFSLSELVKSIMSGDPEKYKELDMNVLMEAFQLLLDAWEKEIIKESRGIDPGEIMRRPVIVIDEANVMMGWNKDYAKDMGTLIRFFVSITKEKKRSHVFLVTSEYGYQTWLSEAIASEFWKPRIIGDFTKSEAKSFFEFELKRRRKVVTVTDEIWSQIYEVCGGNAGTLVNLAYEVEDSGDDLNSKWEEALESMYLNTELPRLKKLALGVDGVYTAAQFADATLLMLSSQHFAVPQDAMLEHLGRHDYALDIQGDNTPSQTQLRSAGQKRFEGLVKYNVLCLRPYSDWALDIPLQAYSGPKKLALVTPSSALALYCLKLMKPDLIRDLTEWKQKQASKAWYNKLKDLLAGLAGFATMREEAVKDKRK
ncbi:hypothetical protein CEUSTIGMA_g13519.t1 [Chlamydomonas eustigma]|uniref:ATPase domain-containing protein n=1 Tax=Chlamydomonas eustigma TaxID=1157962 RepID=A0A250XST9_9CHLO|nr:hypothetical protein CEUSTIGMA_g13519.t1 [Chlamydomonas eustigma]|eukprot:GAX86106.1 hypothetical protein CEUSTIGMA_g13519.t1 [Chlamydomonas eustigma]